MKQYILLDWDGNLAQTLEIWLVAWREALLRRNFHLTDTQFGAGFGALVYNLPAWGITDPEKAFEEADKIAKQKLPNAELYPDALEVLQSLHEKGKQLALVTSASSYDIEHLFKKYDIGRFFDVTITNEDVTHYKPHPESLEKALSELGGTKEQAVMIGDTDKDLLAANNAGIDSILFYPPEHKRFYDIKKLRQANPTHVVTDFRDIVKLV